MDKKREEGVAASEDVHPFRTGTKRWRVGVINGPNMSNLINRNTAVFGAAQTIQELEAEIVETGKTLGVDVETMHSNFEGEILEWLHANAFDGRLHALLVNPAGFTGYADAVRYCLEETGLPYVEIHYENQAVSGRVSIFTRSATAMCHGLRKHTYTAALVGLVGILDDGNFRKPTYYRPPKFDLEGGKA